MSDITEHNRKMREEHTPTPWFVVSGNDPKDKSIRFQYGGFEESVTDGLIATVSAPSYGEEKRAEIAEANAAFIVRAVNAHEELLEMLYAVLPSVEEADEFNKPTHKLGPKVKALIAKAEGK